MTVDYPLSGFEVAVHFERHEVLLRVTGEVDSLGAPEIAASLERVIDRGYTSVLLDLAEVSFLDAAGLAVIALAATRLKESDGELTLRSPSEMVVRLLDITGLADLVRVEHLAHDHLGPEQDERTSQALVRLHGSELAESVRRVTSIPADDDVVDGALRLVVALTLATVGGADGASVSLHRHGRLATVAASDQTISDMDKDQYATGEGPCVDASVEGRWFHVESLDDETRWPAFVPMAKALGINAILSSPLLADERPVGALNIYSRTSAAFAPQDQRLASIFAEQASTILRDAGIAVSDDQLVDRLQEALARRETIALARGILMERDGNSSAEAFTSLRRASQETNLPLHERAAEIVASAGQSSPPTPEGDHRG